MKKILTDSDFKILHQNIFIVSEERLEVVYYGSDVELVYNYGPFPFKSNLKLL